MPCGHSGPAPKAAQTLANVQTLVDTEGVVVLAGVAGADNVAAAKPFIRGLMFPLLVFLGLKDWGMHRV